MTIAMGQLFDDVTMGRFMMCSMLVAARLAMLMLEFVLMMGVLSAKHLCRTPVRIDDVDGHRQQYADRRPKWSHAFYLTTRRDKQTLP
jgi:hypothetical protein